MNELSQSIALESKQVAIQELENESTIHPKNESSCKRAALAILKFDYQYYSNGNTESISNIYEYTYQIAHVKNENFVSNPVKLIARISSISDPYSLVVHEESITVINFSLAYKKNSINVLAVPYNLLGDTIHRIQESNLTALFMGTIVPFSKETKNGYSFYLAGVSTEITAYDELTDTDYGMDELKRKVEHYSKQNAEGIRGYIKETLNNELGIKGLEHARELNKAIDFMILQSLSRGKSGDDRYSNKLHSLIIGAAGNW